jgi:putative nucleotidyltransferase with HDIG domain
MSDRSWNDIILSKASLSDFCEMKKVATSELACGMVIARDVIDSSGRILIPQGRVITNHLVQRLQENHIDMVFIEDAEYSLSTSLSFHGGIDKLHIRNLFLHANVENPLMGKLFDECLSRLPYREAPPSPEKVKRTPLDLVKQIHKVVVMPDTYLRMSELVKNPESSARDFAKIVNDCGLAAVLLRTANSAYFGLSSKVDNLPQAISILGTRQLVEMVLASTTMKTFNGVPQGFVNMESFSFHSIACGMFAREIASTVGFKEVDRFYTAGLLHDVGRLILFSTCPDEMRRALKNARETDELLHICENQVLGFDHGAVGGALLKHWNLPPVLQEAVEFHHHPGDAPSQCPEVYVVHLADILANALQYGSSGEHLVPPIHSKTLDLVKLNRAKLPAIIDNASIQIEQIIEFTTGKGKSLSL